MELSIFLAKVIGWYFVIVSLCMLFRRDMLVSVIKDILAQRTLLFFIALPTLILGLLLVLSHNVWVMAWPVVITVLAWMILIGGILRLGFPEQVNKMGHWWLEKPIYLTTAAVFYLLVGVFLLFKAYFIR